jgi:hypothetical protein
MGEQEILLLSSPTSVQLQHRLHHRHFDRLRKTQEHCEHDDEMSGPPLLTSFGGEHIMVCNATACWF